MINDMNESRVVKTKGSDEVERLTYSRDDFPFKQPNEIPLRNTHVPVLLLLPASGFQTTRKHDCQAVRM
jgi:uncharacterized sporulation protein YeaH/YhbH (DUF444 family)